MSCQVTHSSRKQAAVATNVTHQVCRLHQSEGQMDILFEWLAMVILFLHLYIVLQNSMKVTERIPCMRNKKKFYSSLGNRGPHHVQVHMPQQALTPILRSWSVAKKCPQGWGGGGDGFSSNLTIIMGRMIDIIVLQYCCKYATSKFQIFR